MLKSTNALKYVGTKVQIKSRERKYADTNVRQYKGTEKKGTQMRKYEGTNVRRYDGTKVQRYVRYDSNIQL